MGVKCLAAEATKWCPRCSEARPVGDFYVNRARSDGLSPVCVTHHRIAANSSARAKRVAFIQAMGGRCRRCGFADERALQVDHVNGDGRVERSREGRSGRAAFYAKVLANPDQYMLLCANCNWIKKAEQDETVGIRVFDRRVPTERLRGVGKGNALGSQAALARARTPEHQAAAGRAKKGGRSR